MLTSYKQALWKSGWNPIRPQDQFLNTLQLFVMARKKKPFRLTFSLNYILRWFYKLSENATWTTRVEGGGLKERRRNKNEGKRSKGEWGATERKVSSYPLEHVLVQLEFDGSWTLKTSLSVCCKLRTLRDLSAISRGGGGGNFKFGFGNEVTHPCNGSEIC